MNEPYEGIKLRPAEWEVETAIRIMDPDGWRDPYAKDYATPIDYDEWSWRMQMSTVEMGLSADTELLPAEERLQNALKAIEDRLLYEKGEWDQMLRELDMGFWTDDSPELSRQRNFMSGLDIAWSLAKTESLRRQPNTKN